MTELSSKQAAAHLGVTVRKWHYLVEKHGIHPVRSIDGIRGAKFWKRSDVDRVARKLAA